MKVRFSKSSYGFNAAPLNTIHACKAGGVRQVFGDLAFEISYDSGFRIKQRQKEEVLSELLA
ncbi:hypothetical protein CGRA01v4_01466 [Colletotrichum graminicola]|nr:hypothetical protein CGRA01v4_01466 [Colletotrichum graminicola]